MIRSSLVISCALVALLSSCSDEEDSVCLDALDKIEACFEAFDCSSLTDPAAAAECTSHVAGELSDLNLSRMAYESASCTGDAITFSNLVLECNLATLPPTASVADVGGLCDCVF